MPGKKVVLDGNDLLHLHYIWEKLLLMQPYLSIKKIIYVGHNCPQELGHILGILA